MINNSNKLKIAFLVVKNIARGGGIEKYTLELGRRLVARGHQVMVFSMGHYGEVAPEYAGMQVVKVPCLRHSTIEKLSSSASAVFQLIFKGEKFDIIHLHSVAAGAFAPLIRLGSMGRCILQMHGIEWQRTRWSSFGKNMLKMFEWLSLKGAHAKTAVSKTQCNFFQAQKGMDMRYIPTGAEIKELLPAKEILEMGLETGKYILFASRLVREKGAHYLIPAFQQLDTDFKLVIAGDAKGEEGYKRELRDLAGSDPRIIFPGFVEGQALGELFSNAAVYVQPSEIEGLSIALLEAMSYGNCCLVSDIPENKEAIGDAGFTFQNMNVIDLRDQLATLMSTPDLRVAVGKQARERVLNCYNWDKIVDDFECFYIEQAKVKTY
ncbi:Glycosyltransferase involved in cell wall bisynthesis [Desulfomicrobium apsheronum]|uniref:Glycosyltransferase involved in cell wall bisynthesis n=1 Tax=Desulfomicrobium apsheronum TaxID=52560 RepID=A0A1I3VX29_9BACT|nr:glycosyltransferase family 4 protein [Desulfomicrobium apsheronum]SFJ99795.1 Glycosyltransferase involved in cell wall bisynthesis [Desulfomicrobium apsheronum]